MNFSSVLAATSVEEFRRMYWARAPLKIFRGDANYYDELRFRSDLDQIVFLASRSPGAVEELSEQVRTRRTQDDFDANALLRTGKSLRVKSVQRFSAALGHLSSEIEQALSFPININLYISPPGSSKALRRHFDTHDVFVLQLSGQKKWRLYHPPCELPLEFLPLMQHESLANMKRKRLELQPNDVGNGEPTDEFVLNTGDLLYLPRGVPHEAETASNEPSCHLTVGIASITYLDLVSIAVAGAAGRDLRLRRPLPFGFRSEPEAYAQMCSDFSEVMSDLPTLVDVKRGASQLAEVLQSRRHIAIEDSILRTVGVADVEELTLDSRLRIASGVVMSIDFGSDPMRLVCGRTELILGNLFLDACRYIMTRRDFYPSNLPGNLSPDQKLDLVRSLVATGVATPQSAQR